MLMAEHYSVILLVLVASLGNIMGSCANWFLGRSIARFEDRRWFLLTKAQVGETAGLVAARALVEGSGIVTRRPA